jgi:hypothetical protein
MTYIIETTKTYYQGMNEEWVYKKENVDT